MNSEQRVKAERLIDELAAVHPLHPYVRMCGSAAALLRELTAVGPAPLEAIGLVLSEVMDLAVRNGANSVSMPDQYVEIAVWLAQQNDTLVARELTGAEAEQAWAAATMSGGL